MRQYIMKKCFHATANTDNNVDGMIKVLKLVSPRAELHIRRGGKYLTWRVFNTTDAWITALLFYVSEHKKDKQCEMIDIVSSFMLELMKHNKHKVPYVLDKADGKETTTHAWNTSVIFPMLDKIAAGEASLDTVAVKRLIIQKKGGEK